VANVSGTVSVTPRGSPLVLTGFTPASQLAGTTNGGWQVAAISSGPAAGNGAVLSAYDKALSIDDLATMTELHRVSLTGIPFRIAADETHGTVIVAYADVDAGLTRYASVDVATGSVTPLTVTSTLLSVGFGVSSDGTKLYSCMRDKCEVLPNQ
jgi:L-alanine-DL-glutamate epimerase-like enolase superfamily enzyme